MQCPPPYVGHARPQVWHAMVRHYTSAAYKRKHEEQKLKRAEMGGGSHTQGSVPLAICKQKKVRKCILFTLMHSLYEEIDQLHLIAFATCICQYSCHTPRVQDASNHS
jgi:hypothetical protein